MYVRKKRNSSGSISIQIIKKIKGKAKLVETIGCSKDEKEIERLYKKGLERKKELEPNLFDMLEEKEEKIRLLSISNNQIIPIGDELFFGKLYDKLELDNIFKDIKDIRYKKEKEFLLKSLVISRILYAGSKLYLADYLWHFKKKEIDTEKIYRFLENLYREEIKKKIEDAVYKYTLSKIDNQLVISFYDVTTLYFESESEDDLRQIGFSKEGKLSRPQIQLGLFTTLEGYPLSYEVYHGKKYEGHTLLEALIEFQKRFKLKDKPIVVADRGMLNDNNIAFLENNGYRYILGAKIKMLPQDVKDKIANFIFINDNITHQIDIEKSIKYKDNPKDKKSNKNFKYQAEDYSILLYTKS